MRAIGFAAGGVMTGAAFGFAGGLPVILCTVVGALLGLGVARFMPDED